MKRLFILMTILSICLYQNSISCYAITYEEIAQYAKEHGTRVSQGGTYLEYSTCPGQITPNSNTTTPTNTPQTESKPAEKPAQPVHKHSYIETVTKEPTCIEEGVTTFTCSCGDKYTEPIEMVAHTYDKSIVTQEPTCTVNGKNLISCSICNDTYEEDVKALGHEKGEWVTTKEPTCTENGNEVVSCKRCGEQLEERGIDALGHDDGEWITTRKDTLISEGLNELKCTVCEEVLDTEVIPINMNTWYIIIAVSATVIITATIVGITIKRKKTRKAIK